MKTQQCPSDRELCDFDQGDLLSERYEEVSQHLDSCANCAARFENLVQTSDPVLSHLRLELPEEIL